MAFEQMCLKADQEMDCATLLICCRYIVCQATVKLEDLEMRRDGMDCLKRMPLAFLKRLRKPCDGLKEEKSISMSGG